MLLLFQVLWVCEEGLPWCVADWWGVIWTFDHCVSKVVLIFDWQKYFQLSVDNHTCLFDPNACMHIVITVYTFIPQSVLQLLSFFSGLLTDGCPRASSHYIQCYHLLYPKKSNTLQNIYSPSILTVSFVLSPNSEILRDFSFNKNTVALNRCSL